MIADGRRASGTAAWSAWPRRAVLACALAILGLGTLDLYQHYRLSPGAAAALSVARALPLVVCVSRPVAGWWLGLAACALTAAFADPVSSSEPWPWPVTSVMALVVLLVVVGLRVSRRALVELWMLLGLLSAVAWLAVPDRRDVQGIVTMVLASAVALLLADAWRGRRETGQRLTEQEQISDAERARRILLEERTRIARELHDVVAHHMSVIAIQAEAAPYRVSGLPTEITTSFAQIRTSAVAALDELRRVLGVLRTESTGDRGRDRADQGRPGDGDEDTAAPQPTLARLDDLVAGVRSAGLRVDTEVSGTHRPLPPGVEVSAYRILQEALSNALRHAPGSHVRVQVAYAPSALRLCVANGPPRAAALELAGPGHGLLGMRERAAMLGGELKAGPTADGGYAVTAELPLPPGGDA